MTPNDTPLRLTESQRRHYEVLFARLERTLVLLEDAARGNEAHTELTVVDADIPKRFAGEAPELIRHARTKLVAAAQAWSLRPRTESRRRVCRALITSELNGLTDATSSRLRGFGDVDPSVAEHVDPAIEELRSTVSRLAELLA